MVSLCDWQSSLTFLSAPGKLPRQGPLGLYVEGLKVTTLKHGKFKKTNSPENIQSNKLLTLISLLIEVKIKEIKLQVVSMAK